jgi:two-component system response regulator LytT
MKIVIIEDEKITAEDLAETIRKTEAEAQIVAVLPTIKESIAYFNRNPEPDLIFCDIQLGDGLSFNIFKTIHISSPVIFCTAYDEYAINAFKSNGIDYILKPFTSQTIADALQKYRQLCQTFSGKTKQYDVLLESLVNKENAKCHSILVYHKEKIVPVKMDDIALFYIENEVTSLMTFDRNVYHINNNLEDLELKAGDRFFRVNRQNLINRKAIIDASRYFSRKLAVNVSIPVKVTILVSKERTPAFLKWLETTI